MFDFARKGLIFPVARGLGAVWGGPIAAVLSSGCGSSGGSGAAPASTPPSEISVPTAINLYPDGSLKDSVRLFLFITGVGSEEIQPQVPVAFDTGSAGMTLYAKPVFPNSMVTPCLTGSDTCGFIFPAGVRSMNYNGITITDRQGFRCYGGADGRTEIGNVGYAPVTFGDAAGTLTTTEMPVLFYYKITKNIKLCNDGTEVVTTAQTQQGWFGVNTDVNPVYVGSTSTPTLPPLCAVGGEGTCSLVSVLKYLQFGSELEPGFVVSAAPLQDCPLDSATCTLTPRPMLTVGLTPAIVADFETHALTCNAAAPYAGYPVCNPHVSGGNITVSQCTSAEAKLSEVLMLFDTGTPEFVLLQPAGVNLPVTTVDGILQLDKDCTVTFTTPAVFAYDYQSTSSGTTQTVVNPGGIDWDIAGIQYFENHSLLVDLAAGVEGWL